MLVRRQPLAYANSGYVGLPDFGALADERLRVQPVDAGELVRVLGV
jgi:hypothetical protein